MKKIQMAFAALRLNRRTHFATLIAVALITSILTGALLIGDSMQASLRRRALEKLGDVDILVTHHNYFPESVTPKIDAAGQGRGVGIIFAEATLEVAATSKKALEKKMVRKVQLLGLPDAKPGVTLGTALHDQLPLPQGSEVVLRLESNEIMPSENLLGKKEGALSLRLAVNGSVATSAELGLFSPRFDQRDALVAIVPLATLQKRLKATGKVNAVLVMDAKGQGGGLEKVRLNFAEAGIVEKTTAGQGRGGGVENFYSEQFFFPPSLQSALTKKLGSKTTPSLTYLVNLISTEPTLGKEDAKPLPSAVPYSLITAVDGLVNFAETTEHTKAGQGGAQPIALNQWAADSLGVKLGETLYLRYFLPESNNAAHREKEVPFTLTNILPMEMPYLDPNFSPQVEGITDAKSLKRWEAPFEPFHLDWIRTKDEDYWEEYHTTPKAFIPYDAGKKLFASRFGDVTLLRAPSGAGQGRGLEFSLAEAGFQVRPIRQQALAAATGSTPFGVLFFSLSFFLIISSVLLAGLLHRLSLEQRRSEIATLSALGWPQRKIITLYLAESAGVVLLGGLLGLPLAVGYAAILVAGLNTAWVGAIVVPFLSLYGSGTTLTIGFLAGAMLPLCAAFVTVKKLAATNPQTLLKQGQGGATSATDAMRGRPQRRREIAILATLTAIILACATAGTLTTDEMTRIGSFFALSSALLGLLLYGTLLTLRRSTQRLQRGRGGRLGIGSLAFRVLAGSPLRTITATTFVAVATFVIVSVSAFQKNGEVGTLAPGEDREILIVELDVPLLQAPELDDATERSYPIRVAGGDDISCLNMYKVKQPRVVGIPPSFPNVPEAMRKRLFVAPKQGEPIPVAVERNTAYYSLGLYGGVGSTFTIRNGNDKEVMLEIVYLMDNSPLQSEVVASEENLLRLFPQTEGYAMLWCDVAAARVGEYEKKLAADPSIRDLGPSFETGTARVARLQNVNNTYIAVFQSLGVLALLLGTATLGLVQYRSILERRGEFFQLRAIGFTRQRISRMVSIENFFILVWGLLLGLVTALLAISPYLMRHSATVPLDATAVTFLVILLAGMLAGTLATWLGVRKT